MKRIKKWAAHAGLLYITLYLPFAILVYTPYWFQIHSHTHPRGRSIPIETKNLLIRELNHFFLHDGQLLTLWTEKEKFHLQEVRQIFDGLVILLLISIIITVTLKGKNLRQIAMVNLICLGILGLILPVFTFFWVRVLHPLLFHNLAWYNTPLDVSFYLMPFIFFKYSFVIILAGAVVINGMIWFFQKVMNKRRAVLGITCLIRKQ